MVGAVALLLAWVGVDRYVDADASCPGDGSDAAPYCSLQAAFDGPLEPGDHIRVRDSDTRYAIAELLDATKSGTAADPIVLEPDDGASPVLGGRVTLRDVGHWTIRGLTWDGTGNNGTEAALQVWAFSEPIAGIVVRDNAVVQWEPDGDNSTGVFNFFASDADPSAAFADLRVENNSIRDGRSAGIEINRVAGVVVESNEVAEIACSVTAPAGEYHLYGIRVGSGATDVVVAHNHVHDLDGACGLGEVIRLIGIRVTETDGARVTANLVHNIPGGPAYGDGIHAYDNAQATTIDHNVVLDVAGCGVCVGVDFGMANDARVVANTVVRADAAALRIVDGLNAEVIDNILVGRGGVAVDIDEPEEGGAGLVFEHNLVFNSADEGVVGRWGNNTDLDFGSWTALCGCGETSLNADPMLALGGDVGNVTPERGSPVIDAGVTVPGVREAFHGEAVDVGAVEPPAIRAAAIAARDPSSIVIDLDNVVVPPLQPPAGCEGLTVMVAGEPVALRSCASADATLIVELADDVYAGDNVSLEYAGAPITDSARIGGGLGGWMLAAEVAVDNGAPPRPGTTGGGSDTGAGGPSSGDAPEATNDGAATQGATSADASTGDAALGPSGASGCACAARGAHPPAAAAVWALPLLFARRRRFR